MGINWRIAVALGLSVTTAMAAAPPPPPEAEFTITPWELAPRAASFGDPHVGLESLKASGFTTAAFVLEDELPACRKLGLKALVRHDPANQKWSGLSDGQIEQRVRAIIGHTADDPTVTGYFLRDEPGVGEFPALGKAVALVKKLAPGKLAYINLFPDYATLGAPDLSQLGTASYAEYLERYVKEVRPQFISYDNYRVQFSNDLRNAGVAASYFQNLLEVRRVAREHHLPFWNIVSGNEIRKNTPPPSPANLLMQAYTTLAAGARGLTWYTYYGGGYRYAAVERTTRTATWSYLRMVNQQVRVVGKVLNGLDSTGVYFVGPVPGVQQGMQLPGKCLTDAQSDGAPLMIGEFQNDRGQRYAMVVNLSLERSTHVILKPASGTLKQLSPVDGSLTDLDDGNGLWLAAGQGVLLAQQ